MHWLAQAWHTDPRSSQWPCLNQGYNPEAGDWISPLQIPQRLCQWDGVEYMLQSRSKCPPPARIGILDSKFYGIWIFFLFLCLIYCYPSLVELTTLGKIVLFVCKNASNGPDVTRSPFQLVCTKAGHSFVCAAIICGVFCVLRNFSNSRSFPFFCPIHFGFKYIFVSLCQGSTRKTETTLNI